MPSLRLDLVPRAALGCAAMLLAACASRDLDEHTTSAALLADGNGDREVSCEEWNAWLDASYGANDADGDGVWSEREYNAFVGATGLFQSVPLSTIDTNVDRRYTLTELTTFSTGAFNARDRNGDCVLSSRELTVPSKKRSADRRGPSSTVRRGSFAQ